jgi:hypothetical protein
LVRIYATVVLKRTLEIITKIQAEWQREEDAGEFRERKGRRTGSWRRRKRPELRSGIPGASGWLIQ